MSNENDFIRDALNEIRSDIKELRTEMSSMKSFKWKIVGGATTVITIVEILAFFIKR